MALLYRNMYALYRQQIAKYKYTNVVDLVLSNSKFIGCKRGFKLSELSAKLCGNLLKTTVLL